VVQEERLAFKIVQVQGIKEGSPDGRESSRSCSQKLAGIRDVVLTAIYN
jgi:hypothetical protein